MNKNMNVNLILPRTGVSEGVFPTEDAAREWANRYSFNHYVLAPTSRECWTRW